MSKELHVVFGTGSVGCWIARALRKMGYNVRAVNRSGKRPVLMPVEVDFKGQIALPGLDVWIFVVVDDATRFCGYPNGHPENERPVRSIRTPRAGLHR